MTTRASEQHHTQTAHPPVQPTARGKCGLTRLFASPGSNGTPTSKFLVFYYQIPFSAVFYARGANSLPMAPRPVSAGLPGFFRLPAASSLRHLPRVSGLRYAPDFAPDFVMSASNPARWGGGLDG